MSPSPRLLAAACLSLAASCATTNLPPSPIDFVAGCWVQKNAAGDFEAFLRLAPDAAGAHAGFIDKVLLSGPETALAFAPDGSAVRVSVYVAGKDEDGGSGASAPLPAAVYVRDDRVTPCRDGPGPIAVFRRANSADTLIAEGAGASLRISLGPAREQARPVFDGARCD